MTFAGAIGIPKAFNVTTLLIFLCSLGVVSLKPVIYSTDKADKALIWSFLVFGISLILASIADLLEARGFDKPSRFLLAIPVLFLLLRSKGPKDWLWYGVVIGAILAFLLALYERIVLGVERASGGEHPIMFGDTAMMLGWLSFVAAAFFFSEKRSVWVAIALFAGLSGMGASVLSGSRGGWVAVPFIGLFMFWQCRDLLGKKHLFKLFLSASLLVVIAVAVPQTGIQKRVGEAVSNIDQYLDGTKTGTSVGTRFDMWKASIHMFQESPIFGVGASQVQPIKRELADQGRININAVPYDHAHNEYFHALSTRGLVGLLLLLMVYLVPMKLFLRKLHNYKDNWRVRSYAIAGALIPMCYMDFALTQSMFMHNIGVMMYAFPIVFFWAALRWAEREELEKESSV
ncbi:O-antigen ligase family protein [Marinomonas sp. A79]|uniref:O-antigen ligase family protein n=2 Tax=Marinomonas vulgaris TaxID=2823372 RepID=A0ABS5H798_9GAMM|nr:O-antigen ligase family protein [Marinomonas vulgaris]